MRKISVILLLFFVISCQNQSTSNDIDLFNSLTFHLNDKERNFGIEPDVQSVYSSYFNNTSIQIPLYKYIAGNKYKIFIGLPYNTSLNSIIRSQMLTSYLLRINVTSDSISYYNKYEKDEIYLTECVFKFSEEELLYISTMSYSEKLQDSLFNKEALFNRISRVEN